ncbi:MAG: lipopolysaccharide biosynthesis protein [Bacteroidales bacterium]|nr:lipopolysaccharide biosynthesis protein [Bacteroidales bacterium]
MEGLRQKTTKGIFWSFLDYFGVYLVKFAFTIVIARTLSPDDYGLMGMIVIFIAIGQTLMQSGFSMALIQKREHNEEDFFTAFWFNILVAVIVYLILFFGAGAIAGFFGREILVAITRVAATGIIINSLCSVQVAILTKRMDFRKLTWIHLLSALISGITGLLMALKGYEVWALVFQTLSGNVIYLAGLWFSTRWKPRLVFDYRRFRSLFNFGYKVLLQGLTDVIFTKSYYPLIGKFFPVSQLGFYTNANRFHEIFVRQTSYSASRVVFPAFATIQDDRERFRNNYIRSFNLLTFLMFLGSLILIITSRPFISVALTAKWLPSVPFMQLFFIDGFFLPLLIFNINTLYSTGRGGASLRIDILRKALILISIIVLFRYGIEALIAGQVFSTMVSMIYSALALGKIHDISYRLIFIPLLKLFIISGLSFALSSLIEAGVAGYDWIELLLKVTVVPLFFVALAWLTGIHGIRELRDFMHNFMSGALRSKRS